MRKKIFILLALLSSFFGFAEVQLTVNSSSYKNKEIIFYKYSDYITKSIDTLSVKKTGNNGELTVSFNISETTEIFIDLERYRGILFLYPEQKEYRLKLPEYEPKNKEEELNIFFKPQDLYLIVENEDKKGLNRLISSFNNIYDDFLISNYDSIYYKRGAKLINDFDEKMNQYYSEVNNHFFTQYKKYKISTLRYLGINRSYKAIDKLFYNNYEVLYNNPAYMNLFNLVFSHFFVYYNRKINNIDISNIITYSRSPKKFRTFIKSDFVNNDTFSSLIMLKGLYDELFYPKSTKQLQQFPQAQMMVMLDSVAQFGIDKKNKLLAKRIIDKFNLNKKIKNLSIDHFVFENSNGKEVNLKEFRGKYVYLNIVQTDIFPAMEAMDRLTAIHKHHQNDITIISIFTDKNKDQFLSIDKKKYPWTLLYMGKNEALLKQLRFVTWPQFHLIDPYGKLILSPAPTPQENFERYFLEILNSRS